MQGFIADVVRARTRVGCKLVGAANYDASAVYSAGCTFPPVNVSTAGASLKFQGLPVKLDLPPGAIASSGPVGITVSEVSAASFLSGDGGNSSNTTSRVLATNVYDFGPDGTQ